MFSQPTPRGSACLRAHEYNPRSSAFIFLLIFLWLLPFGLAEPNVLNGETRHAWGDVQQSGNLTVDRAIIPLQAEVFFF